MAMKFPLNTESLNKIKANILSLSTTFQTKTIPVNYIGSIPGGRMLVEAHSWPIDEALQYFEKVQNTLE
ncbi:MAG TPA: hypothetical protein VLF89_04830 [Candidatus Saccharimonadales bacterium]|nr:hypothetical protein [Candidatus Saccharimonadales bacterium]